MTNDATELRMFSNQIANDVRKDLYLSYKMGIEKGRSDAIDEIKSVIFGTFANDTMKILELQRWLKEQNSNSNSN